MHAKALRLEGSCYRRSEKEQALIAQRDKALKLYPRSPDTEELCYSVATYFDVNCESAKAWEAYKILYERFPKGRYAERAAWKLALFALFRKGIRRRGIGILALFAGIPESGFGRCRDVLDGALLRSGWAVRKMRAICIGAFKPWQMTAISACVPASRKRLWRNPETRKALPVPRYRFRSGHRRRAMRCGFRRHSSRNPAGRSFPP